MGREHYGTNVHGDIDIIPSGTPSRWEFDREDAALVLSFHHELLASIAEECGFDSRRLEIKNRFQMRDAQIEHLGWALKAEMDAGYPGGRLYVEGIGTSLAVNLLTHHSSFSRPVKIYRGALSGHRLRRIISFVEENLNQSISLADIAAVAGLSLSHCNTAFRETVGMPLHRYIIRRRVERAKELLGEGKMPTSQIALEVGFAHQSHLALHMRRELGLSPKAFREQTR